MKDWKAWLGVAVSAFLLWWVFRGEDPADIASKVASGDLGWLVIAGALSTSGGLIRAIRWRILLAPLGERVPLSGRWRSLNIGFAVTNVALGRLGEVARPYALSKMVPISTSAALGTVVLERVLDLVALVALLALVLLAPDFPANAVVLGQPIGVALTGIVSLAVITLVVATVLVVYPDRPLRWLRRIEARVPPLGRYRVSDAAASFVAGMDALRAPSAVFRALLWSFAVWIWMAASFWAAFQAYGLELGFTAALFTQCVVAGFVALPAAPGFLGTLQTGVLVSVAGVFGVPESETLAMAVGYHLAGYIPVTAFGLYYAWSLRLSVAGMRTEAEATA